MLMYSLTLLQYIKGALYIYETITIINIHIVCALAHFTTVMMTDLKCNETYQTALFIIIIMV